jgi:hypothetical protein
VGWEEGCWKGKLDLVGLFFEVVKIGGGYSEVFDLALPTDKTSAFTFIFWGTVSACFTFFPAFLIYAD